MEEAADVRDLAAKTWQAMKRTAKAGQRRTLPDMQVRDGWGRCWGNIGTGVGWGLVAWPSGGVGTRAAVLPRHATHSSAAAAAAPAAGD